ncbi:hypothetical protein pb186bvf_008538 [Paramecium bursaria]
MPKSIFIAVPNGDTLLFEGENLNCLYEFVNYKIGIPIESQKYHLGGKSFDSLETIQDNSTITLFLGLLGGKGGFGSLLKNQAQTRRKIMNFDQSRDREGRRIGNYKNLLNLIDFFKTRKDADEDIKNQVDKVKIMEQTIKANQKNVKLDNKYIAQLEKNEKLIENSFKEAPTKHVQKQDKVQKKDNKKIFNLLAELEELENKSECSYSQSEQQE